MQISKLREGIRLPSVTVLLDVSAGALVSAHKIASTYNVRWIREIDYIVYVCVLNVIS